MKKILLFAVLACMSMYAWADTKTTDAVKKTAADNGADPVLMTIGNENVLRSEFEYYLNKHSRGNDIKDQKVITNYLALFTNFKLKAIEARKQKLEKDSTFQKMFTKYRDEQLATYLVDSVYLDSICRLVYGVAKASVGDSDVLSLQHIVITYPAKANDKLKQIQKAKADSIYQLLLNGKETFDALARKYSNDRTTALHEGKLPWVGPSAQRPEFTKGVYSAPLNKIVMFPVPNGYEIVRVLERKPFGSYESQKADIYKLLKDGDIDVKAFYSAIDKKVKASKGKLTRDKAIAQTMEEAFKKNPAFKYKVWEYFEGMLSQNLTDKQPWSTPGKMTAELEKYFQQNKSKFSWDKPRFKGWVIATRTPDLLKATKLIVDSLTSKTEAKKAILKYLGGTNASRIIVNYGTYKEGMDYRVDNKMFGKHIEKNSKFAPYYDVMGKLINAPECYEDDKGQVIKVYQIQKEAEWMKTLIKKYPVHINKSVLPTVNNHE